MINSSKPSPLQAENKSLKQQLDATNQVLSQTKIQLVQMENQSIETERKLNQLKALSVETENRLNQLKNQSVETESKLAQTQEKLAWWEEQFKLARARRFSSSSEKHSTQLGFFDEIETPVEDEDEDEDVAELETITTPRKKAQGRKIDTSKLPREVCYHELSDADKQCDACGNERHPIGEDKTEKLVYIPAHIKVIEHVYPKFACRICESIKMPAREEGPIPKSMATSSLIAEIIIGKYERHIPLYRQSKIFAREGIDLPDNTLGNWVMQAADVLSPLGAALIAQFYACHYLQADETPVKVLAENKKGYMWCYHSPSPDNRFVLFDYHLSRGANIPKTRLADFSGILQTDGYSGYNPLRERNDIVNVGCFAHCRRKFNDAWKIGGKTTQGLAHKAIQFIGKLYRIESAIKALPPDEKKARREKQSRPILNAFFNWLIENNARVLPKSQLGSAFTYAINQWPYLSAYADYGDVNIDNNWAENQIRPFALGRRNWLFIGNQRGGQAAALLYSLIQTCKMNNINSRAYFHYVLEQTHKLRRGEIDPTELLPQFIDLERLK